MAIVTKKLQQDRYYIGDPKEAWTGPFFNGPFPSFLNSHCQTETKCKTFQVKMSFTCIRIKHHFHAVEPLHNGHLGDRRKWPLQRCLNKSQCMDCPPKEVANVQWWPLWRGGCQQRFDCVNGFTLSLTLKWRFGATRKLNHL